jgi:hypothetical protein
MIKWRLTKICRPLRGLDAYLRHIPGVPLRSTPGFTLPPAPQAEKVNVHFAQQMWVKARLYVVACCAGLKRSF